MQSVIQQEKACYICGALGVHDHHIFGAYNRKKSEKYGLKVWLCPPHHNMSDEGVHFNKSLDLRLKREAQRYYEANIGTRADFIREFGKSVL